MTLPGPGLDSALAAGRILQLLEGEPAGSVRAALGLFAGRRRASDDDAWEEERWELLRAIAQDARPLPSPAAIELLRHLAAGRLPRAAAAGAVP